MNYFVSEQVGKAIKHNNAGKDTSTLGGLFGHSVGTPGSMPPMNTGPKTRPPAKEASGLIAPRLLDLAGAASYLGISTWTVRGLETAGILPRVRVPLPNHGELRKLLFDRVDLDHLIDVWKDRFSSRQ